MSPRRRNKGGGGCSMGDGPLVNDLDLNLLIIWALQTNESSQSLFDS